MANIIVTTTDLGINVSETLSNITVTDVESNVIVTNVASSVANVTVSSTDTTVNVSQTASISNASVRTKLAVENVSGYGNLAYDTTDASNGIFQYTGVSNVDIITVIDDNPANVTQHLSVTDTGGDGSLSYNNTSGVFTYTGPNQTEANARIAAAPSQVRAHISLTDAGGDGSMGYNSATGVITYQGPSAAETRAHFSDGYGITYNSSTGVIETANSDVRGLISGVSPITYNSSTGAIGLEQTLDDLTLKKYQETIVDAGNVTGTATFNITNGTVHTANVTGNITNISLTNISTGGSATLFLKQDAVGGHVLDTSSFTGTWEFINNNKLLDTNPNSVSVVSVFYDGTTNFATVVDLIQTTEFITVNGTTINIGDSGNITTQPVDLTVTANALIMQGNDGGDGGTVDNGGIISFTKDDFQVSSPSGHIFKSGTQQDLVFSSETGYQFIVDDQDATRSDQSFKITALHGNIPPVFEVDAYGNTSIDLRSAGAVDYGSKFIVGELLTGSRSEYLVVDKNQVLAGGNLQTNSHLITNSISPLTGNVVTVFGNMEVNGNLNVVEKVDLLLQDSSITLNYGNATARDAQIIVDRSGSALANTDLRWNETTDRWQFSNDGSTYNNMLTSADIPASAVTSVNGDTGVVVLDTDDIAEGTAKYYATSLFNTDFATKSTSDLTEGTNLYYTDGRFDTRLATKSTSDLAEGTNLYYTDTRVQSKIDSYVLGSENITVTSGVLATTPALGNTNSLTAQSGSGLTFNSDDGTIVTSKFGINSTVTETANIAGKGFGVFNFNDSANTAVAYSGTDVFEWYIMTGSTTAASTTLTITSMIRGIDGTAASVSDLNVGQVISNGQNVSFPVDAYVVSINSGAGTVEMSKAASFTNTFGTFTAGAFVSGVEYKIVTAGTTDFTLIGAADNNVGTTFTATGAGTGTGTALETNETILDAGIVDTTTGLVVTLQSDLRVNGGGSDSALEGRIFRNTPFGYPASGPVGTDFDIFTAGSGSDYTMTLTPFMMGSTPVTNNKTALNAPLGITIGENTQLTNRGENDIFKSFGMNMMWDGLDSDLIQPIQPQVLFKSYTDNSQQKPAGGSVGIAGGAPRLFFSTANGNANADAFDAYPRANQELGRLSFWGSTGQQLNPSSYNVPGFISVGAADDWDTWGGSTAGNTNVYMGATSNGSNPDTYLSYKSGELFLGGGNSKPVTLAPAHNGSASNPSEAYATSPTKWAEANYASGVTGAKFSVTNGGSVDAGVVGDMELSLKRNDNSSTLASPVRSLLSGSISPYLESGKILLTFNDDGSFGSKLNGLSATVSAPSTIDASVANGGNPFYGSGNETALGNNVYDLSFAFSAGGVAYYYILSSGSRVGYTDISGSDPYYFVTQTLGMTVTTVVSSGVTAKEWKFNLAEQSNNLLLQSDGTTKVEFTDDQTTFTNIPVIPSHSNVSLPTSVAGGMIYVTNGNNKPAYGDGTNWYYYDNTQVT
jgi:hypothetical protein